MKWTGFLGYCAQEHNPHCRKHLKSHTDLTSLSIFHSELFSNTCNLCYSIRIRGKHLQPNQTKLFFHVLGIILKRITKVNSKTNSTFDAILNVTNTSTTCMEKRCNRRNQIKNQCIKVPNFAAFDKLQIRKHCPQRFKCKINSVLLRRFSGHPDCHT